MDLTGATCLVTGANRGIGAALAGRLAREPLAKLLLGMRSPAAYAAAAPPVDGAAEIRPVRLDLSSRETIDASWAGLAGEPIDLLINNAGQMTGGLLEEQEMDRCTRCSRSTSLPSPISPPACSRGCSTAGGARSSTTRRSAATPTFRPRTTYAASKAGVVALTESLRRELKGTGVDTLHLITPGVNTGMLDDTEAVYGRYMDTSGWERQEPDEWAEKVVAAIRADARKLEPGGKIGWAVRAARGPAGLLDLASERMFSREPRR